MQDKGLSFSDFLWDQLEGRTLRNKWTSVAEVPAKTEEAESMAKALKSQGFKFCGPVIVYAFMQATGMVNDHLVSCHCHDRCHDLAHGHQA